MELKGDIDRKLYCRSCKRKTNHGYLQDYKESSNGNEGNELAYFDNYYITQCKGCDTIAFYREYGDEDMLEFDGFGEPVHYTDRFTYPEQPETTLNPKVFLHDEKVFENAPELISDLYSQVVSSFNSRHYLLCAVGLRMIVEGVCKEMNITEGCLYDDSGNKKVNGDGTEVLRKNLEGKINGLHSNGIIVKKQAEILHQIRDFGNVTVHELKIPRKRAVHLGIEIIENMLHNIFDLEKYNLKH